MLVFGLGFKAKISGLYLDAVRLAWNCLCPQNPYCAVQKFLKLFILCLTPVALTSVAWLCNEPEGGHNIKSGNPVLGSVAVASIMLAFC